MDTIYVETISEVGKDYAVRIAGAVASVQRSQGKLSLNLTPMGK